MKRLIRRRIEKSVSIGIVGVNRGIGVTHLCLTLANFFHSKEGYEVLYIECAKSSSLLDVVEGNEVYIQNTACYRYKGVNYVFTKSIEEIKELIIFSNCIVIIDFENIDDNTLELFGMCSIKYVIGSMKPWCRMNYISFIQDKIYKRIDIKQINFLAQGLCKEEKRDFYKYFDCTISNFPILGNPFKIKQEEFKKIEQMIM